MLLDHDLFELFDVSTLESEGLHSWLRQTLDRCARWFEASGASVFLRDSDGVIRLRSVSGGLSQTPPGATIEIGHGIAGTVLQQGIPRLVGDPKKDPILAGREVRSRSEIISSMVVPLLGTSNEPVGVVNLSRSIGEQPFCEDDLDQAKKIGAIISMAVVNAQLISMLKESLLEQNKKAEELKAVLESVAAEVHVFDVDGHLKTSETLLEPIFRAAVPLIFGTMETGVDQEAKAVSPDSDRTWLLRTHLLSMGGGVLTIVDVSDYQHAQDEASRLRRLAEIGQMTAAVAHEIRNPLTGIRGAAQLIGIDPSLAVEYSKVIEEEAIKLERLCNDFLEISKPMRVDLNPVRLSSVAENIVGLWHSEFENLKVNLTLDCLADDPTILIDVRRLEQVIHNLLQNALQASKPGGEVKLIVGDGSISVIDNGMGMDETTQGRLFAPFFTTKSDGTGLGLCNVRRIVDAHGANIECVSQLGEGTRFDITFPRSAA